MKHELPKLQNTPVIPIDHFPTRMQCFVFRNWEMIEPRVLGDVLGCDADTVTSLAAEMGLPTPPDVDPAWLTKGYITIIRANWHLCSYAQIAFMLGISEEQLAYILREDDFLSVKLGNFKPEVPPLVYAPLTEEEHAKTRAIRQVVSAAFEEMPHHPQKPFDFKPFFASVGQYPALRTGDAPKRFDQRIVYSYCALYGDTFSDRALIDESFPDELLSAYQSLGVTGVWTQAVLYTLAPYPFAPALSEGWERRQEGMRYLVAKLAKYDLKLFLYMNEPRAMPLSFFDAYPHLKGHVGRDGYASLCVSTPEVQDYLRGASRDLNAAVPGLGGYLTITASENQTNCYSHANKATCTCPRCKEKDPSDIIALTNRLLYEGAAEVNPDFRVLAWSWAWKDREPDMTHHVIEKLPAGVAVMGVSEEAVKKNISGTETFVIDYSISVEGPGEYALDTWRHAHENGHDAYAKLQLGVTWEISTVPCVPAYEKIRRHLSGIIEQGGVDGIMLGWTLGGFPSPTLRLAQAFYADNGTIPDAKTLYGMMFPTADADALTEAFVKLSDAYDAYPFYISTAYVGPQQVGSSNLLYPKKTGYTATMTGMPYDDITGWRSIFPQDVYVSQIKQLSDGWHEGTLLLERAARGCDDVHLTALVRWSHAIDCHFRSIYNQCMFVIRRDEDGVIDTAVAAEEAMLAAKLLTISCEDPMIGYESSNHYFYHRNHLLEKLVNCDYLMRMYQ